MVMIRFRVIIKVMVRGWFCVLGVLSQYHFERSVEQHRAKH